MDYNLVVNFIISVMLDSMQVFLEIKVMNLN